MLNKCLFFYFLILLSGVNEATFAQNSGTKSKLAAGPMQGYTTDTSTNIWLMIHHASNININIYQEDTLAFAANISLTTQKSTNKVNTHNYKLNELTVSPKVNNYQTLNLTISGFDNQKKHTLSIQIDSLITLFKQPIRLAPDTTNRSDFSFLLGSCAMDMPKILTHTIWRKHRPNIFSRMAEKHTDAAFMIWMGDNVYYGKKDFKNGHQMFLKNAKKRANKHINKFIRTMPQYAIWDDHDYGPNNSDASYVYKDTSLQIFQQFWANPAYGEAENKGIYHHFRYQDAEFFMLDVRYHKNQETGELLGSQQLEWLQQKLKTSTANFKFIVLGSQAINPIPESFQEFPKERTALLNFIRDEQITGVLFLTGDRHYGDLNVEKREGLYPIYDFTASPLTSFNRTFVFGKERKIKTRVKGSFTGKINFGKISLTGKGNKRTCKLALYNKKARLLWDFDISLDELQF